MVNLHHIAISTKNTERLIVFYKKLGFSVSKKYFDKDLKITWISNSSFIIELFEYKNSVVTNEKSLEEGLLKTGLKHFAFSVKDIISSHKRISLLFKTGEIKEGRLGSQYFFIKDPDGNFIEFIEN